MGQVPHNSSNYNSATFNDLWDLIVGYSIPTTSTRAGDTYTGSECTATVLHPDRGYNTHDNSVVGKLSCGEIVFLLTGDVEWESESTMLDTARHLWAEILTVPRHGSSSYSCSVFLDAVQPEVGVISGEADNPCGHPSSVTLNRLLSHGVALYRADQNGTVTIRTNGTTY